MVEITKENLDKLDLTTRERLIMALRYGLVDNKKHTLEYVGKVFGITRERVRQIQAKIIIKLK